MVDAARAQDNYRLTYFGANGVAGGGDDVTLPVLPQYLDGSTMLRLSTLADLSAWTETDYGFPHGILGDWQLDATTGSVVQGVNGGATFFTSNTDLIDREFAAQLEVESANDDDFIGVVFGLRADVTSDLPDSYYVLAWKKAQAGGAPGGLRLARVTGTGEMGQRPDLWQLSEADPHIDVLATGPNTAWESGVRYDFRVLQESSGEITLSVKNAETGGSIWNASVTDPNPLGRGKVGFYNFSQANVRHWNLRTTGSLPQGVYQIEVFGDAAGLLDAAGNPIDGNADGTAGGNYVHTFTVDIGVPTIGLDLQTASDTGVSASDNLTKDNTPTFDIAANRSGLVEIFVDNALDPVATLGFGDAGTQAWTAAIMSDGPHTVRVRFTPDLGNPVETTLNVEIDTVGPYLLNGAANVQAPVYSRTVKFSEAIDSLATAPGVVLTLTDPDGTPVPLSNVVGSVDTYTVSFNPQVKPGQFRLAANTAVVDLAGNAIDQDRDGVKGEVGQDEPIDRFTVVADVGAPQVTSFSPRGLIKRPISTLQIGFSEEMNPVTLSPSDVLIAGPAGTNIPAVAQVRAVDSTNRLFEIVLAAPLAIDGAFTVTVGPDVRDISGNGLAVPYQANFQIALPLPIPSIPGDGVFIELFNSVGGGTTPTPAALNGLTPDGTTLSPQIDFPRPGSVVSVGDSFVNFFANTTTPPDAVVSLSASNFTLRNTFYVAISQEMDRNLATPEIDVQFGVGSDDGFYLTIDDRLIGSAGDRGFTYSWYNFSVESAGLFPVELLYAANAVGVSGLEFSWNTALSAGNQVVPQQYLYVTPILGDQKITFEELPAGASVSDQYRSKGVLFETISGALKVTNAFPADFIPVSPDRVFADPNDSPTSVGEVELTFVVPGTNDAATTNFISLYLLDAEAVGATITAFDPEGNVVFSQTVSDPQGGASQKQIVVQRDRIARVNVTLGQGADTTAIDNITFNTPTLLNSRPNIQAIDDIAVNERALLSFSVLVADLDLPTQTLSYTLAPGAPPVRRSTPPPDSSHGRRAKRKAPARIQLPWSFATMAFPACATRRPSSSPF